MKKISFLVIFLTAGILASCGQREPIVIITTDLGEIIVILYDETPEHKKNFIELAKGGFYNGTTFHRIVDKFMIQGGDPNSKDDKPFNDGRGSPGYLVPAEISPSFTHVQGALAAARQPDQVNPDKSSNGSQFYIIEAENGYHSLDGNYTIFGQVISGMEVVEEIAIQPKSMRSNRPLDDIIMTMEVKTFSKKKITKLYGYEFKLEK